MKTSILAILLFFAIPEIGYPQVDSAAKPPLKTRLFPSEYGEKRWKFIVGLDARRSFFRGVPVKINGLRTGAEFKGVHRFGIGVYALSRQVVFTEIEVDDPAATDTSTVLFNVGFASLFYERIFFKSKKWELAIPSAFSRGTITGAFEDTSGLYKPFVNSPFSALALGFQTKYFILPWLAPRLSVGYRFTFNAAPEVKRAFNQPYLGFGIQILLGGLYRSIFKKEEG